VGPLSTSANDILFLPHHPDRWAQYVRNRINPYLVCHLLELQNVTPGVVDLRSENLKWYSLQSEISVGDLVKSPTLISDRREYHFVKFATKIVVLCYSVRILG
jgi:hypothetical protein